MIPAPKRQTAPLWKLLPLRMTLVSVSPRAPELGLIEVSVGGGGGGGEEEPLWKRDELHGVVLRRAGGEGGLIGAGSRHDAVDQADRGSPGIISLTFEGPAAGRTGTGRIRG